MSRTWFKTNAFVTLEIEEFQSISVRKVIKSATIQDIVILQGLVDRIARIDPNGGMMVSWGSDAHYMTLTFKNETETEVIEIIQEKFKTPSTGFHGRNEEETSLCNAIRALLN